MRVQTDRGRHQFLRDLTIRRLGGYRADVGGEATGRGIGRHLRGGAGQALGLEGLQQGLGKHLAKLFQGLGRQFFDKQFE